MSRRAMSFSIGTVIALVIGLLLIWFFAIPAIQMLARGVSASMACDGECMSHCPAEDYTRDRRGDVWCQDEYEDRSLKCCNPMYDASGGVITGSDVKLYYNRNRGRPLRNGERVELTRVKDRGNSFYYTYHFDVAFSKKLLDDHYFCYGQITRGDKSFTVPLSQLFSHETLYDLLLPNGPLTSYNPAIAIDTDADTCRSSYNKMTDLQMGEDYDPQISTNDYFKIMGASLRFDVVVVDRKSCRKYEQGEAGFGQQKYYLDTCNKESHTVNLDIPVPSPVVSLKVDGQEVEGVTSLSKGERKGDVEQHTFQWVVQDPFPLCEIEHDLPDSQQGVGPDYSGLRDGLEALAGQTDELRTRCAQSNPRTFTQTIAFGHSLPGGVPFELSLRTALQQGTTVLQQAAQEYRFLIEPDDRLQVFGPAPGISRSKTITIQCESACNDVSYKLVGSPWECNAGTGGFQKKVRGVESTGTSLIWEFAPGTPNTPERPADVNGKYLCVRAEVAPQEYATAVGTSNGEPQPFAIDRTPPGGVVRFNDFDMIVTATCTDPTTPAPSAGCAQRPFSYSFVTDPLLFAGHLTGLGGELKDDFDACPDPYEGGYIPVAAEATSNAQEPATVYRYMGTDVMVICVAIKDAAGNYYVKPKTLYSAPYMIAMLINELA